MKRIHPVWSIVLVLPVLTIFSGLPVQAAGPNLAGRWTWKWEDGKNVIHRHELIVEGEPGRYAARERIDDQEPVKVNDLEVNGKDVSFNVLRGEVRASYKGQIADNDTINGQVTIVDANNQAQEYGWTAHRQQP